MRTSVSLKLANGKQVPILLQTLRRDGDWLATAEIQTAHGPVRLSAVASETTARALLEKMGQSAQTAGFFDSIAKFAQSSAVRSVLEGVATLSKNPLLQQAASFYPPAAIALQTVNKVATSAVAAQNILARARQRDPKAIKTLVAVRTSAAKGVPAAQKMLAMLQITNESLKQQAQQAAQTAQSSWGLQSSFAANAQQELSPWSRPSITAGAVDEGFNIAQLIETARRFGN